MTAKGPTVLLDIGCGWGAMMLRAIEKYDVNVIGLTLSKNQATHVQKVFDGLDSPRSRRVLLAGWEQFDEPVDRIVSIGAFDTSVMTATTTSSPWPTRRCPTTASCCCTPSPC